MISSGTSFKTFNSYIQIIRVRDIETLAIRVRSVIRERRVSEYIQMPVQAPAQPIVRRRNSIANAIADVVLDSDFAALIQQAVRNG